MAENPDRIDREIDRESVCAAHARSLGIRDRLSLFAGRPRRLFNNLFRKGRVQQNLDRFRRGQCHRCGACCQMGLRCHFLYYVDGLAACKVYDRRRSPNCRSFPADERDLADRDMVLPEKPCGYSFDGHGGKQVDE